MSMQFQSISAMPPYKDHTFEELRVQDYTSGNRGGATGDDGNAPTRTAGGASSGLPVFGGGPATGSAEVGSPTGPFGGAASTPFGSGTTRTFGDPTRSGGLFDP